VVNIGNKTQASLKSSGEGRAIGIVYCKFPIVYFVEVFYFYCGRDARAPTMAMVSEAKFRSVSGGKIGTSNWKTVGSGHRLARLEIRRAAVP